MTAVQLAFLVGLTGVLAGVVWFAVTVVRGAARSDGGPHVSWGLLRRLGRLPEERAEFNRWAFYLHRLTGMAILGFLCLHILDVSTYAISRSTYGDVHELYGSAPMRVFESGLLFAILFHTLNGLRILAIDIGDLGQVTARRLLVPVAGLTLALGAAGTVVIMAPVFA
jgi:succinate dehydrogenase / fumarate reductase, cytochrome b subunit